MYGTVQFSLIVFDQLVICEVAVIVLNAFPLISSREIKRGVLLVVVTVAPPE